MFRRKTWYYILRTGEWTNESLMQYFGRTTDTEENLGVTVVGGKIMLKRVLKSMVLMCRLNLCGLILANLANELSFNSIMNHWIPLKKFIYCCERRRYCISAAWKFSSFCLVWWREKRKHTPLSNKYKEESQMMNSSQIVSFNSRCTLEFSL